MPFFPTLMGCSSWPSTSGMKAGSPMPDSISITCVVAGFAIIAQSSTVLTRTDRASLRGFEDRRRQIDAVLVQLREAARDITRRNDVADDHAAFVEPVVLAHEDVRHLIRTR